MGERCKEVPEVSEGAGVAPAGVLLLTKKRTFFHKKNQQQNVVLSLLSSEQTKKPPNFPLPPQYFKMMVLLLYIQNQDEQKMTKKKNQIKFPEKKIRILLLPKTTPKIPQKQTKNLPHTTIFFLQVMNKILERKKITKRKQNKQEKKK